MPAINVARTDTFEVQRQKINQIGANLFQISQGGSDLSTGLLKLGDGSKVAPSLAFTNDSSLGVYRPSEKTIGYVSGGKQIFDISESNLSAYKNFFVQKNILTSPDTAITNPGSNYESGTYTDVVLSGGSGTGGTTTITILEYDGTITQQGLGYSAGSFGNVTLSGGSGTGASVSFSVDGIDGNIISAGTGYTDGNYNDVPIQNGSGAGALASVNIFDGGVFSFSITDSGSGYQNGDIITISASDVGGTGGGFSFEITTDPGEIKDFTFGVRGDGYQLNDVLTLPTSITGINAILPGEITGVSSTLSTLSAQITVADTTGIQAGMLVEQDVLNDVGILGPGTTVQSVDSGTTLTLSQNPQVDGAVTLTFTSPDQLTVTVSSTAGIQSGSLVTVTSGNGALAANTTVSFVDSPTTFTISQPPTVPGNAVLTIGPAFGDGTQPLQFRIDVVGVADTFSITDGGNGYAAGDVLSVSATQLVQPNNYTGSVSSTEIVTFTGSVSASNFPVGQIIQKQGDIQEATIYDVKSTGGVIDYIIIDAIGLAPTDIIERVSNPAITATVDTVNVKNKYFIDLQDGNGSQITPDLTFYVGDTYIFDVSSFATQHPLYFSTSRDGKWDPGNLYNVSTTLSISSKTITIADTTGIVSGMDVQDADATTSVGILATGTKVDEVIDSTTFTITEFPVFDGDITLNIIGSRYEDGVTRDENTITIVVSDTTPSPLYYYCDIHSDMGGEDNDEAVITVNPNNPRIFGSGLEFTVLDVESTNVVEFNVDTGAVTSSSINSDEGFLVDLTVSGDTNLNNSTVTSLTTADINTTSTLEVTSPNVKLSDDFSISTVLTVDGSTGDFSTNGELKTLDRLNVGNTTFIDSNVISSTSGVNLILQPASSQVVRINATTALQIPSGVDADRPATPAGVGNGYIRFNTQTNQYEGYSDTNSSWSSLGGVRDLDGNTTILAEETVGSNDNTLWFINDNVNTVRFTPQYQEFVNVKKIRSLNVSAPDYTNWLANTPVSVGQYLKYRNNIYEVTVAGTTATSGNEPTHTSGSATNGTSELTWYISSAAALTFDEISEVRIDPLGFTDFVVNGELRFSNNTISSTVNDIIIQPTGSQKVEIKSTSSLVIPVGDGNSKGNPKQGSIRYNTTDAQFEGFNGSQWGGLGGVKDVDQDTKITAESAPGADEDVLAFFNANNNTLNLTTTQLELNTVDTIASTGSGNLNLNASLVTFNNLETSIDNSSTTISFLSTTKDNLDFGLATGIVNDHLVRLTNTGEIIYNLGFGTGTPDNLTVLNNTLTNFELSYVKTNTSRLNLERGTLNSGNATVYSTGTEASAKVFVTAHNTTTGDKEVTEYFVTDNGTDIFFTETNNVKTGSELISALFDLDPSNNVRISITLDTGLTVGDTVFVTIIKTITKR